MGRCAVDSGNVPSEHIEILFSLPCKKENENENEKEKEGKTKKKERREMKKKRKKNSDISNTSGLCTASQARIRLHGATYNARIPAKALW